MLRKSRALGRDSYRDHFQEADLQGVCSFRIVDALFSLPSPMENEP